MVKISPLRDVVYRAPPCIQNFSRIVNDFDAPRPLRSSTPEEEDPSGASAEKAEKRTSNRNKISNLQRDLADWSKQLGDVAFELAKERKLGMATNEKAARKHELADYYEGRARHFQFHARSFTKRLRLLDEPKRDYNPIKRFYIHSMNFLPQRGGGSVP